jgi:hypothetical protein
MRHVVASFAVTILVSSNASAGEVDDEEPPPAPSAAPVREEVSPGVAVALSLSTTAVGAATMLLSAREGDVLDDGIGQLGTAIFLVGPSVGHWYARDPWNAGLGMRLVGVPLLVGGALVYDGGHRRTGDALATTGLVLYAIGAYHEIVTAPRAAHEYNVRAQAVTRVVFSGGPGTMSVGLAGAF